MILKYVSQTKNQHFPVGKFSAISGQLTGARAEGKGAVAPPIKKPGRNVSESMSTFLQIKSAPPVNLKHRKIWTGATADVVPKIQRLILGQVDEWWWTWLTVSVFLVFFGPPAVWLYIIIHLDAYLQDARCLPPRWAGKSHQLQATPSEHSFSHSMRPLRPQTRPENSLN